MSLPRKAQRFGTAVKIVLLGLLLLSWIALWLFLRSYAAAAVPTTSITLSSPSFSSRHHSASSSSSTSPDAPIDVPTDVAGEGRELHHRPPPPSYIVGNEFTDTHYHHSAAAEELVATSSSRTVGSASAAVAADRSGDTAALPRITGPFSTPPPTPSLLAEQALSAAGGGGDVPNSPLDLTELLQTSQHSVQRRGPFHHRWRFAYVIRSTRANHGSHLRIALRSWAERVPLRFVASDSDALSADVAGKGVWVHVTPDRNSGAKALAVLKKMAEERDTADFFLYVDDETFVSVPNFEGVVEEQLDAAVPVYAGCLETGVRMSVVGGLVFSRATLELVSRVADDAQHACSPLNRQAQERGHDEALFVCMAALGVAETHLHGFNRLPLWVITAPNCGGHAVAAPYQCSPPVSRLVTVPCYPLDKWALQYFTMNVVMHGDRRVCADGSSSCRFVDDASGHGRSVRRAPVVAERDQRRPLRFAYSILTTQKYHQTRLRTMLDTWAKDRWVPLIISDDLHDEDKALVKDRQSRFGSFGQVGRTDLGGKTIRGMAAMCDIDADFFVLTDDDCFVFTNNLESTVAEHYGDPDKDLYLGSSLTHLPPPRKPFASGGAGVVFSNRTMRRVCELSQSTTSACGARNQGTSSWPGDTLVGACMEEVEVPITHHDGFHPLPLFDSVDYAAKATNCDVWWIPRTQKCRPTISTMITAHYTAIPDFQVFHFLAERYVVRRSAAFGDPPEGAFGVWNLPTLG